MNNFDILVPEVKTDSVYAISGPDCQVLSISLAPNQSVSSEPGAMMMMSPDVKSKLKCGSCTRTFTGETCCYSEYTNEGKSAGFISLTANFPAKIVPIVLPNLKGKFIAKKGAYMSSVGQVDVSADYDCCTLSCCFGGLGCCRQAIEGNGTAFLAAGGTVLEKTLADGEKIVIDTDSIVGFQPSVQFGVQFAGGCTGLCYGGEGCFSSTLTGPGHIIVQSMPFEKYVAAVAPPPQQQGGRGNAGAAAGAN